MNLLNQKATHIKFGTGVITSNEDGIMKIQFDETIGVKSFFYPSAFERFLKLENPMLETIVKNMLDQIEPEKEKQRQAAEALKKEELSAKQEAAKPKKRVAKTSAPKKATKSKTL